MMLVSYDTFRNQILENLIEELMSADCRFFAQDLMEALEYEDGGLFEQAIEAAKRACAVLNIPIHYHFKTVFIDNGEELQTDYLISPFACYLITINADPAYPAVARAQLYFVVDR